ncbi:transmembrane protein 121B-like [Haliotis rubra]|uniref:transmembrane protein 121B-like n=1 Tax=Haliotis rubra TaxID=36100 RepID=UPI001EE60E67|nr:transmembrane protein 121B-like [Haliotis rubra]
MSNGTAGYLRKRPVIEFLLTYSVCQTQLSRYSCEIQDLPCGWGDCFVRCCGALNGIPARIFCILLLLAQGGILDYFLAKHQTQASWAWIAFDLVNVGLFIASFVISRRHLALQKVKDEQNTAVTLGWLAWLVYSVSLVARMAIAFNKFSFKLSEDSFFGPNTLKTSLALASCVFVLLLTSHHDAAPASERRRYIEDLTGTVVFDVLDTVDVLEVMFDKSSRDMLLPGLQQSILLVAGLNLIIPTVPLITLNLTNFGYKKMPKRLVALHKLLVVLVVNVPNLIVRLVLWHGFSVGISPFMLKNLILISIVLYEFYEHKRVKYDEHAGAIEVRKKGSRGTASPAAVNGQSGLTTFSMQERI